VGGALIGERSVRGPVMDGDVYYLAGAIALFVLIVFSPRIVRGALGYLVPAVRDGEAVGTPFSEEYYSQNHADGLDYDLQQALRRATRLAHQNRTAEALAVLRVARGPRGGQAGAGRDRQRNPPPRRRGNDHRPAARGPRDDAPRRRPATTGWTDTTAIETARPTTPGGSHAVQR